MPDGVYNPNTEEQPSAQTQTEDSIKGCRLFQKRTLEQNYGKQTWLLRVQHLSESEH